MELAVLIGLFRSSYFNLLKIRLLGKANRWGRSKLIHRRAPGITRPKYLDIKGNVAIKLKPLITASLYSLIRC